MILAHAVLILIALAYVRSLVLRRDLIAPTAHRSYRGGWKLVTGVGILFVLQATLVIYAPGKTVLQMVVLTFSLLGAVFLLLLNRHLPGVKLVILGAVLNLVVVLANGGWMPVSPETAHFVHPDRPPVEVGARPPSSKNIILDKKDTNLWILSDIIRITVPWRRTAVSIGDVLLVAGIAQFIFQVKSKEEKRDFRRKKWGRVALAGGAGGDVDGAV